MFTQRPHLYMKYNHFIYLKIYLGICVGFDSKLNHDTHILLPITVKLK